MKNFKERREIIALIKEKQEKEIKKEIWFNQTKNKMSGYFFSLKRMVKIIAKKLKEIFVVGIKIIPGFFSFLSLNSLGKFKRLVLGIIDKIDSFCLTSCKKVFYETSLIFFLIFLVLNLKGQINRFQGESLLPEVRSINFFPTLPFSNINFSKKAFDWGYYDLSINFYNKVEKLRRYLGLSKFKNKSDEDLKKIVLIPEIKNREYGEINKKLSLYPYNWELILNRAQIEYELNKKEELGKSLALLWWLNPKIYQDYEKSFGK